MDKEVVVLGDFNIRNVRWGETITSHTLPFETAFRDACDSLCLTRWVPEGSSSGSLVLPTLAASSLSSRATLMADCMAALMLQIWVVSCSSSQVRWDTG